MLLGGNLGFWCSVVAVVSGWLVGHWKWRRVAARREEIRRLMILASEETARAELEAASAYRSYGSALANESVVEESVSVVEGRVSGLGSSPSRKLQYQCEVCFSPTTTRCKQCKATHYCSRKCQILHWRQGHKDECRSVTTHQNTDAEVHSYFKEFNQDEIGNSQNGNQVLDSTKSVKSSADKCLISSPTLYIPDENINTVDIATEDLCEKTDTNVNSSVHLRGESLSFTTSTGLPVPSDIYSNDSNRYEAEKRKSLSEQPILAKPAHTLDVSIVSNKAKSGCIVRDEKSESSSSLGCTISDSKEHFSEPSSPSNNWSGAVETKTPNINSPERDQVQNLSSRSSSLPSSGETKVQKEILDANMNGVQRDGRHLDFRNSNSLLLVGEDGLNSKEAQISSGRVPGQNVITRSSPQHSSKEKSKLSPNGKPSSEEGGVPSKNVDNLSNLQSVRPNMVGLDSGGANDVLISLKSQKNDFTRRTSSETHLPSGDATKKTSTVPDAQSVENVKTHKDDSLPSDRGAYVRSATNGTNHLSSRRVVHELSASNLSKHGSFGAGGGFMRRHEGLFPYELFVKLYHWNEVELRPRGLKNCGNSCYANAVLQCLASTPPLTAYFLQGLHAETCHNKNWCFTCEFERLIKKTMEGNYLVSPARLMSQMKHVASHLGNGREEDAHEFLRYAIEAMQIVSLKDTGVNAPSSLDENTTLLGLTFGGYLQSKIECMRCGEKSKQHDRIMDLTVEIGEETESLEDALRQFTCSEILDGENKYHCGRCKSYEKAKKRLRVLEAPNVLTIVLKRYQSGQFGKLNKSVKFPEVLNLARYVRGTSDKSPIYQLYGAVIHLDVKNATFTGHYVCYVRNNKGNWFKADDSWVQPVEVETVLSNDAYMLFYARCSPRAPRLLRNSMDPRKSKNPTTTELKFHPVEPWRDVSLSKLNHHRSLKVQTGIRSNYEDENLTEHSSFFSETGSHSTTSSRHGSTSTADDSIFSDQRDDFGNWTNSPSSSSSLSSPIRAKHSPLADLDRYSSDAEADAAGCGKIEGHRFWAGPGMRGLNKEFTCRNASVDFDSGRLARAESCGEGKFGGVGVRR